ncbi:MAG: cell division protein FtsZ [Ignavibacteriales bacterium]
MSELNSESTFMSRNRFATLDREEKLAAKIKVIGVGGGGGNALDYMISKGLKGVEYIAINTDAQVLEKNLAEQKINIGKNLTKGLGAGADPNVGRKAIEEDRERISKLLEGADMVFVTAGMGGGTGTGAAPIIASIAKSIGALVIAIVTKPFNWEGKLRMRNATEGINELRQYVDSLIVIPNERILNILDDNSPIAEAFDKPNEVLYEATRGISEIITVRGKINVDFADVRSVMNQSGIALMGCGVANGANRAIEAATKAITSPLLEGIDIKGAKNILINVTGPSNLSFKEVISANKVIQDRAGEEANIIFGVVYKEDMNESISYTVIATGFSKSESTPKRGILSEVKNPKEEPKRPNVRYWELNENEDKSIPTIKRMQKRLTNENEETEFQAGFNFRGNRNFENEQTAQGGTDEKEEGGKFFLSMMMD